MSENQNIEYKESWNDDHLKQLCSFANAQGGVLYVGINDKGEIVGIDNYKKLTDDLPNKIQSKLGIFPEINLNEQDGMHFLEIHIRPSSMAISLSGRYYQRTGSTTKELVGNALTEFLLRKSGMSWGDVIEEDAMFDDIDNDSIAVYLNDAERSGRIPDAKNLSVLELLDKLNLTKNGRLKRAAIILFGKNPEKFYRHTYVKVGRFVGGEISPKFHEIIEGNIISLQKRVFEIIETKFIIKNISFEGVNRIETPEYPFPALREAILNALIHRDYMGNMTQIKIYDDRLQIWNDGSLVEGLTVEMLKQNHPSRPRNRLIADACLKGGYIEAWGTGIPKIIDTCKSASLPEPEICEAFGGFQITIFKDRYNEASLKKIGLNERQIKAVLYVKENGSITNSEYQKLNDVGKTTATEELGNLSDKDLLFHSGTGRGSNYTLK
ncbi:transcriptional regulator [Geovibrio thiophilus]|uniref:Transcriptional regulator n=1 Tax=Geovibrio thiophilus TaxID=139438 RepID=A0A3R5V0R2_9BACT|nr:ATP-binding protein [Geovibrio thiophilus]QAR32759.1 transcriptional regulator [Geovibrio thiophilus]